MKDLRGELVGKYELLTQLSAGGMAELFLGCTSGPGGFRKYVVIKRILPDAARDEAFMRMFLDEARITAGFSHPNVAQVYDLGEDGDGLYVVMEFIAGQNLNQVTATCAQKQEVLPLGFSTSVVHDCALALHYAHTYKKPSGEEYPVVHRDVAQKNIMVTYDGQVKLLDFGIAKAKGALSRTKVGTVKGTTGYMSPEQVRGEELDRRSDVFSLGVVLWEMSTGTRLFSSESELEEMRLILEKPIESPTTVEPVVPEELSEVIMRALSRTREQRWGSAKELARALSTRCPELFFDADQRTGFMRELFQERIARTAALFEATDTSVSSRALERVVEDYRKAGTEDAQAQKKKLKAKVGGAPAKGRATKQREARRDKRKDDADEEQMLRMQAQVESAAAQPEPRRWQLTTPFFLVVGLLVAGAIAYKVVVQDSSRTASGLKRFPGEPEEEHPGQSPAANANPARPIDAIPGKSTFDDGPVKAPVDPVGLTPDRANAATPTIALPETKEKDPPKDKDPARRVDRESKAKGSADVTLALLPDGATVLRGKQELGKGPWIQFSLPAGTHLLTVVGPDGVKRKLSLPVTAGQKKTLKLRVDELPSQ